MAFTALSTTRPCTEHAEREPLDAAIDTLMEQAKLSSMRVQLANNRLLLQPVMSSRGAQRVAQKVWVAQLEEALNAAHSINEEIEIRIDLVSAIEGNRDLSWAIVNRAWEFQGLLPPRAFAPTSEHPRLTRLPSRGWRARA
jgi:hypothetical protein